MRWSTVAYGISVLAHLAAVGAVARIPKGLGNKTTVISMFDSKKHEKPKEKKEQEEEKAKPKAKEREAKPDTAAKAAQPSAADNTPPPQAAQESAAHAGMAAMPDFGISLGGLSVGGPGIAVPVAGAAGAGAHADTPQAAAPKDVKAKVLSSRPKSESGATECEEETVKPRQLGIVRPQYTDEARSAGIEGKVRVEITIGPDGEVSSARIVSGLGHGLDEAAITAAKRMKFAPATRCGQSVESKFTIAIRFGLVE
jgi:periplasmic protein TonB